MTDLGGDYFVYHSWVRRFPWSLYHRPLDADLAALARRLADQKPELEVLALGCGLVHELDVLPPRIRLTAVDIDPRVIERVRERRDARIVEARVITADAPLSTLGRSFDLIYAKEVIEHLQDPPAYVARTRAALAPDGWLWLSTPNYGEPWLPVIERTVLEMIARRAGFSRRHIHPSPFSRRRLSSVLTGSGFREVTTRVTWNRLALTARAQR